MSKIDRRRFLGVTASAVAASTAGCLGGGDNTPIETAPMETQDYSALVGADIPGESSSALLVDYSELDNESYQYLVDALQETEMSASEGDETQAISEDVNSIPEILLSSTVSGVLVLAAFSAVSYGPVFGRVRFTESVPELDDSDDSTGPENPIGTITGAKVAGAGVQYQMDDFQPDEVTGLDDVQELERSGAGEYTLYELEEGQSEDGGFGYGGFFALSDTELITLDTAGFDDPEGTLQEYTDAVASESSDETDISRLSEFTGTGLVTNVATEDGTSTGTDESVIQIPYVEEGATEENAEIFRQVVEDEVTGTSMTLDAADGERIARVGFAFESDVSEDGKSEFIDALTQDNDRENIYTEDNLLLVESFWS